MKHKHADLIYAWADGAEIELKSMDGEWVTSENPSWYIGREYRIKPEEKKPVVRWLWATSAGLVTEQLYTEKEVDSPSLVGYTIKLEWSRTEFPE